MCDVRSRRFRDDTKVHLLLAHTAVVSYRYMCTAKGFLNGSVAVDYWYANKIGVPCYTRVVNGAERLMIS